MQRAKQAHRHYVNRLQRTHYGSESTLKRNRVSPLKCRRFWIARDRPTGGAFSVLNKTPS